MPIQRITDAAAALLVLLTAAALSVFQPRGMTRYGFRLLGQVRSRAFDAAGRARLGRCRRGRPGQVASMHALFCILYRN
ncbi:hypothetical protein [Streptomyces sp. NPDC005752]|uniref:hypothetical protein n=1 Tax=Streptomyces sp. NPDC005752 TaxID=3157065 RepID=UPI0034018096